MHKKLVLLLMIGLMIVAKPLVANAKFTLVIDAGHGGHDTGAPGAMSLEKDINLRVALAFGQYVERNCSDVRVIYTRKTDFFVPLYERANIANEAKADLFVSIHTNALPGGATSRGLQTYTLGDGKSHGTQKNLDVAKRENSVILQEDNYQQHYVGYDPNSPESDIMFEFVQYKNLTNSIDFAKIVQKNVCSVADRPNRGVHQSNLAVLRLTSMPACLIELGFITTPDEEQLLNDSHRVDEIARGLYQALVQYKNKYNSGGASSSKPIKYAKPDVSQAQSQVDSDTDDAVSVPKSKVSQPQPQANRTRDSAVPDTKATALQSVSDKETEIPLGIGGPIGDKDTEQTAHFVITRPSVTATSTIDTTSNKPVFKIQIFASSSTVATGDARFKELIGTDFYTENNMIKYTYGSSTNYNEINKLYKQVLDKFPDAFIIAFKNGEKVDVNQAIREFKHNKTIIKAL